MKPSPEVSTNARSLRVAYVIEDYDNVHPILDKAFSESFSRDGGRQSLIIPVVNKKIPVKYISWFKIFDPDIVFISTSDNENLSNTISINSSSLYIIPVDTNNFLRFELPYDGLSSLSWLPFLKVTSGAFNSRPELILDSYPKWQEDGLITDNFGTLQTSFGRFPIHKELEDIVSPLMLTPTNAPTDRWRFRVSGQEINDGYQVLNKLTRGYKIITLAHLSNINSKHYSIRSHEWIDSFCLVVGDSYIDRISCWNAGLLFNDARHQAYKTLRLPISILEDDDKIELVKIFLNHNNFISRHGNQPRVTIRSASLSEAKICDFKDRLNSKGSWCICDYKIIKSIEDCCPFTEKKENPIWISAKSLNTSVHIPLRHKTESVPISQPYQLRHAISAHPICSQGNWISEYTIDRTNDHSRYANTRHKWILPKRNELANLFLKNIDARITANGTLSVPVDSKIDFIEINEPDDKSFFYTILHGHHAYSYPDIRRKMQYDMPYQYSRTSDKGRYLNGILGMFGSIDRAYDVLTNTFWRKQFKKLCASSENQYPQVVRMLKKRFPPQSGKFIFERDDQWEKLARTLIRQAPSIKQPKYAVKFQTLLDDYILYLNEFIENHDQLKQEKESILSDAKINIRNSLGDLCKEGIFHQGYGWLCGQCGYRNWTSIDELRMILECQVCRLEHKVSVDMVFDFRLNEFFATCIREYDTLSVIWALGKLKSHYNCSSFIFTAQTELFIKYPDNETAAPDREIDLLCVRDGQLIIGEVKTTISEIDTIEINNLIDVAEKLNTNMVVICAMEGEKEKFDAKLQELRDKTNPSIMVNGVLGNIHDDETGYYLP